MFGDKKRRLELPPYELFRAACESGLSVVRPLKEAARESDEFGWNFGSGWPPSYEAYGRMRALATLENARSLQPKRILEIAAGDASLSASLAEQGVAAWANDLRAEALTAAVEMFETRERITVHAGNCFELDPERTGRFDLMTACEVIEHVAHPVDLLRQLKRLIEPGGHILLTTPNGAYFHNRLPTYGEIKDLDALEARQFKPDADGHLFLLTPAELNELAVEAGHWFEEISRRLPWRVREAVLFTVGDIGTRVNVVMPICIYCKDELGTEYFNREHVIPLLLGSFENNQTLIHTVCAGCNKYFSVNLELAFGRDSFEAIFRLRHGQKPVNEFGGFVGERLNFRIPAGKPGAGVVVTPAAESDGNSLMLMLPPQVGVQREGETEYRYYTEEELQRDGPNILPAGERVMLRMLAAKEDDVGLERLRALVRTLFPKFREKGDLDLPPPERIEGQIIVEVRGTIDKLIARAVAKIAFNYVAKHAGTDFALNPCFDLIRRFIRYDEGGNDWREFVRIINEPLLAEETEDLRVTQGHIVMLGWSTLDTVQVRVSPYNSLAYEVTMTKAYVGVWRPLKVGHVFDWVHRVIHELTAVSSVILPPGAAQRAANAYTAIVGKPRRES